VQGATWFERARRQRAARALERQLEYQTAKAASLAPLHEKVIEGMKSASSRVRSRVKAVQALPAGCRTLEVGSGAHGLIFFFDTDRGIGIDPLAVSYSVLFPRWQRRAMIIAALGEALPLRTGSFDVVLSDNVVDHAQTPAAIVEEMARVLAPSGVMYFTVNVHHPIYAIASAIHAAWNAVGIRFEIGPFADHTTHLTESAARRLFRRLPLRIVSESVNRAEAKEAARKLRPRHLGGWIKRAFFKNVLYEVIAIRQPS
jgi:SAM-dependent methyltransferase